MGINNFFKDYCCLFTKCNSKDANPSYIYIDIYAVIYKLAHTIRKHDDETHTKYMRKCDNILKERLNAIIYRIWFMNSENLKGVIILKDDETQEKYINKWCRIRKRGMKSGNYVIPKPERVAQLIMEYYRKRDVRVYSNITIDAKHTDTSTCGYVYLDAKKAIGWKETDQNIYRCILNAIGNEPAGYSIMCIVNDSDYIMMDTVVRYRYKDYMHPTVNYYMINYRKPVQQRYILRETLERILPPTVITIMYMMLYTTRYGNDYIYHSVRCKSKEADDDQSGMTWHNAFLKSIRNNTILKRIKSQRGLEHLYYLYDRVIQRCRCNGPIENELDYYSIIQYMQLCLLNDEYIWYSYNHKPQNNICTVNRVRNVLRAFKEVMLFQRYK